MFIEDFFYTLRNQFTGKQLKCLFGFYDGFVIFMLPWKPKQGGGNSSA